MSKNSKRRAKNAVAAVLGAALASTSAVAFVANQDRSTSVDKTVTLVQSGETGPATAAAYRFVDGLARGDDDTVWLYASEEDQAAFATQQAVYDAFAELYPALQRTEEMVVDDVRQEGDTPFVDAILEDDDARLYRAEIGLWLDDAGDWKIISLDVKPAGDLVASR